MPGRTNYYNRVRVLCDRYQELTGTDPLEYVSRPGGGEPPHYVFHDGHVALGGREAWLYAEGLVAKVEANV